jgi:hypothetical protein
MSNQGLNPLETRVVIISRGNKAKTATSYLGRGRYPGSKRYENLRNHAYVPKKKLSRDQAALIWQLQTEIRAAKLTIQRVLDDAGYSTCSNGRSAVLTDVRVNRGRISNARDA